MITFDVHISLELTELFERLELDEDQQNTVEQMFALWLVEKFESEVDILAQL